MQKPKMRMHLFCLLLSVGLSTVTTDEVSCVVSGCKCKYDTSLESVKSTIHDCDNAVVITKDFLKDISSDTAVLCFQNVVIDTIDKEAFRGLRKIETLTIKNSSIGKIHENAFDYLELQTIAFEKTTFGEYPTIRAEYVIELVLRDCELSEIPNLDYLPALEYLNVDNNRITSINERLFRNTKDLEEASFAHNKITYIPPNLFINTTDFNTLNLAYNPLEKFELSYPINLEILTLSYCHLTSFDQQVTKNLATVNNLTLNGNSLSVLPIDVFEPMKKLNIIDLSNNKLVELDDNIFFENDKLDKIILDNNPFEILPKFQSKAKSFDVTSFSCKNCGLKSVNGVFTNMNTLKNLDLSNNKLKKIDAELSNVRQLLLSGNELTAITDISIGKNPTIEIIDLSRNPLVPLDPVGLTSMPNLKILNISSCNLERLWSNHNAKLLHLQQLLVDHNQLATLSTDDLSVTPNLDMLKLDGNPVLDSQDWQEISDYLSKNRVSLDDNLIKTHEEMGQVDWSVTPTAEDYIDDSEIDKDENEDDDTDGYDDEDDGSEDDGVAASVLSTSGFNLAKASYILSVTSVFILTALFVLFVAVVLILLILRRNNSFNMRNSNLPRLKIPLWHTQLGQKKHSGSVYKPLSEELSGSRTPIISRYEFKQTPQVHNSIP